MNYKKGNKVRVKTLEELKSTYKVLEPNTNSFYNNEFHFAFVSSMQEYCGREITIDSVIESREDYYTSNDCFNKDNKLWKFEDWMLEDIESYKVRKIMKDIECLG